jgi:hypothetical protein
MQEGIVKRVFISVMVVTACLLISVAGYSVEDEAFSMERMNSDLKEKIELSKEQWERLKPVLGEKSEELKKSISEYVDKGYLQMEEMSQTLKGVSEDTEQKLKTFLNSEEMEKLKSYLDRMDEDAIREARDKMVAELADVLALTEVQLDKLKPVLEDSLSRMSELIDGLAERGKSGWEDFKNDYKALIDDLKKKLKETLDDQQMERFEEYEQDKQDKIERAFA